MEEKLARKNFIENYNNFSSNEIITAISILVVLRYSYSMEITKLLLIEPLLSYKNIAEKFKLVNLKVRSIEELIVKSNFALINFNKRFQEKLLLSINSLFLLEQLGLATIIENKVYYEEKNFDFENKNLGNIAYNRIKSAKKISGVLKDTPVEDLYLHLRVEL